MNTNNVIPTTIHKIYAPITPCENENKKIFLISYSNLVWLCNDIILNFLLWIYGSAKLTEPKNPYLNFPNYTYPTGFSKSTWFVGSNDALTL